MQVLFCEVELGEVELDEVELDEVELETDQCSAASVGGKRLPHTYSLTYLFSSNLFKCK